MDNTVGGLLEELVEDVPELLPEVVEAICNCVDYSEVLSDISITLHSIDIQISILLNGIIPLLLSVAIGYMLCKWFYRTFIG